MSGPQIDVRRNTRLFLADAIGWQLGQSFLSPQTILPLYIALLSKSNLVIGLIVGIQSVGQLVPQLLSANLAERLAVKRRYVVIVGILLERLPFLVLAIATLWLHSTLALLLVFFTCWIVANLGVGLNVPPYMALYAKGMPANRRGRVTGVGNFGGTFLAVGGAFLATLFLERLTGLAAFALIFLVGFVILLASLIPLWFIDEGSDPQRAQSTSVRSYLREIPVILRTNRAFTRYILLQISLQLAFAATPFMTSYAVLRLHAPEQSIGYSTAILMGATALGSLVFGYLGDAHGYRRIFVIAAVIAFALYTAMSFSPPLSVVFALYSLAGFVAGAAYLGNNMSVEFTTPDRAATYTAIVYTAAAPVRTLGPLLLGFLGDRVGMPLVFAIVAAASLFALFQVLFRVTEPRLVRVHP